MPDKRKNLLYFCLIRHCGYVAPSSRIPAMPDKRKNLLYFCLIILAAFTVYLGYFVPREETIPLMVGVGLMFAAVFIVLRKTEDEEVDLMYYWSILLRVLLIASIPKLSDDV